MKRSETDTKEKTWKCFITLHFTYFHKLNSLLTPGTFRLHKSDWLSGETKQQLQVGNENLTYELL